MGIVPRKEASGGRREAEPAGREQVRNGRQGRQALPGPGRNVDPAELAECVAPLCEEGRRAVRRYWEQVIREELFPVRRVPRAVPLAEDGRRERRAVRRAVARIAAAGRAAHVVVLVAPNTAERTVFGDEAA